MARKYRAFISYSHSDSRIAGQLHRWLEGYRIPKRLVGSSRGTGSVPSRLRPIFRDREELPTSANLGSAINEALSDSDTLIVVCSPKAATSRWVNQEILAFKRLGREGRIFCLIVTGEPHATLKPGQEKDECFPLALRFVLQPDGELSSTPAEPIAADIRPGKDSRRDAWLKLAAGIAGVGFDELKQRELQRQVQRALVVTLASTALLLVMVGLTVAAVLSRSEAVRQRAVAERATATAEEATREAERQRDIAKKQKEEAEKARDTALQSRLAAEDLINFMTFDLRDSLKELGRIDLMKSVLEKLTAYHEERLRRSEAGREEISAEDRRRRNIFLVNLGDLASALGDRSAMQKHYTDALKTAATFVTEDSPEADRKMAAAWHADFALLHQRLGDLALSSGDFSEARDHYEAALPVAEHLYADARGDAIAVSSFAAIHLSIGKIDVGAGRVDDAEKHFSEARLAGEAYVKEHLSGQSPPVARASMVLGLLAAAYEQSGQQAMRRGDFVSAKALMSRRLELEEQRSELLEGGVSAKKAVAVAHDNLGDLEMATGNLGSAQDHYEKGKSLLLRLAEIDPRDTGTQRLLALNYSKLGDVRLGLAAGDASNLVGAADDYRKSRAVYEALLKVDPSNVQWERESAVALAGIGKVHLKAGKLEEAMDTYRQALTLFNEVGKKSPRDARFKVDLAVTYQDLGFVARARGDLSEAQRCHAEQVATYKTLVAMHPENPEWQSALALAHVQSGDVALASGNREASATFFAQAQEVMQRLRAREPGNVGTAFEFAVITIRISDAALEAGDKDAARSSLQQAMAALKEIGRQSPSNSRVLGEQARVFRRLASLAGTSGTWKEAQEYQSQAIALLEPLFEKGSVDVKGQLVSAYEAMCILASMQESWSESRDWALKLMDAVQKTAPLLTREKGIRLRIAALKRLSECHHRLNDLLEAKKCEDEIRELEGADPLARAEVMPKQEPEPLGEAESEVEPATEPGAIPEPETSAEAPADEAPPSDPPGDSN